MAFEYLIKYNKLTDKEIVGKILTFPHNEEAAAFLLYNRYDPLLHSIYNRLTKERIWYDDCVDELFIHLKCKDGSWRTLASFEWRSTFGCWLRRVARKKFIEVLPKLIEHDGSNLSLETNDNDPDRPSIQLPDGGEENYERLLRKVMLMEAIGQLKDDDQRFVIIKYLEGYSSNEIAILLQKKWEKQGIVKYGYKKNSKVKEIVVPDAGYVDVRTQRAKANLRRIMDEKF